MFSGEYLGFRYMFGAVRVENPIKPSDGYILVDLNYVKGKRHVLSCVMTAIKSFLSGKAVARDLYVEFLVRLTGERQINRALNARASGTKGLLIWIGKESEAPPAFSIIEEFEIPTISGELDAIEKRLLIG